MLVTEEYKMQLWKIFILGAINGVFIGIATGIIVTMHVANIAKSNVY